MDIQDLRAQLDEELDQTIDKRLNHILSKSGSSYEELFSAPSSSSKTILREEVYGLKLRIHELFSAFDKEAVSQLRVSPATDLKTLQQKRKASEGDTDQPSPMVKKFLAAKDGQVHDPDMESVRAIETARRNGKEFYFLYGSLMDPPMLKKVLGSKETPVLQDATIIGYTIKMWGKYPALLDGDPGELVRGKVCEVQGEEQKQRLQKYETTNYTEHRCNVSLVNNKSVPGITFFWAGDTKELKEGSFDLKDWQLDHVLDE